MPETPRPLAAVAADMGVTELRVRGPCTFRRRDVVAAIRAVEASGHEVGRIEIERDGKIVIIPARAMMPLPAGKANPWDDED